MGWGKPFPDTVYRIFRKKETEKSKSSVFSKHFFCIFPAEPEAHAGFLIFDDKFLLTDYRKSSMM